MRCSKGSLGKNKTAFSKRNGTIPFYHELVSFSRVILLCVLLTLTACNRKEFKGYKGEYACNLAQTTWTYGEPTTSIVTTGHTIAVEKKNQTVVIFGKVIDIDAIEPGVKHTFSEGDIDYTVRMNNDSLLYQYVDTAFGYGTRVQYVGVKKE